MMKRTLLFLLIVFLISCNNDKDELELYPDGLKKRVFVGIDGPSSDSIVEYYEDRLITRAEWYTLNNNNIIVRYITYDFNSNMLLTQVNFYNDKDLTDLRSRTTYFYDENLRIQKIEYKDSKPTIVSPNDQPYHGTKFYEYQEDTVRTYEINNYRDTRYREWEWVIMGNLDSIMNVTNDHLSLFNDQNDLIQIKYLGDPEDGYSLEEHYSYGNTKEPLMHNFFGNRLNLFLIPDPIRYYQLELTSRYLELRSNPDQGYEIKRYRYMVDAKNQPLEMRSGGDVITYFYN